MESQYAETLVRSKLRVATHGEVFTPSWLVDAMLDQVGPHSARIEARFLEPACGSGNFVVPVLRRKLALVQQRHGRSTFERRHFALLALMSIYGIELLEDNAEECRANMLSEYMRFLTVPPDSEWAAAGLVVVNANIIRGDALTMRTPDGSHIVFPEWGYLGRGKFMRRDFRLATLATRSSWNPEGCFVDIGRPDIFTPVREYSTFTVKEMHG